MKTKKNTLRILFVCILLLFICASNVNAIDQVMQGADDFLDKGDKSILNAASIKEVSDKLFNIFSTAAVIIVLIVGAVLGIQFMMGSIEEKVKIKEALIPYIIGAVIIFGAIGIWTVILKVLQSTF